MMKVIILAGGFGTRLSEETETRPKPMVEIGEHPVLWHIMKHYDHYGFREFMIALGYKGDVIKRFFTDYNTLNGSISINLKDGNISAYHRNTEDWNVHLIETGLNTQTGGRLKQLEPWLKNETFMLTYGDCVSNIDLQKLLSFHKSHGRIATTTAVRPPSRFGDIVLDGDKAVEFMEKPQMGEGWISGGFMVFEPAIFKYLKNENTSLEANALKELAGAGELMAYRHDQFWQCMDTLRDVRFLENLWKNKQAPWKLWN